MSSIISFIRKEPASVGAFVLAVIALVATFGLKLTADQVGAIMALVALVVGFIVRSQVRPVVSSVSIPDKLPAAPVAPLQPPT